MLGFYQTENTAVFFFFLRGSRHAGFFIQYGMERLPWKVAAYPLEICYIAMENQHSQQGKPSNSIGVFPLPRFHGQKNEALQVIHGIFCGQLPSPSQVLLKSGLPGLVNVYSLL